MNCERCGERMSDAAAGDLPARQRDEFDAHVQDCAACGAEFNRVRRLIEAIDRGVTARVAADPSPEFAARIRRRIAEETADANAIRDWWMPAAVSAAVIILAAVVWMTWLKGGKPGQIVKTAPTSISPTVANHAAQNLASAGGGAAAPTNLSSAASIRRVAAHNPQRIEREPEVLVPSGEAETVMELAALLRNDKLDGAKVMAELQRANEPIEIKPLVIMPLEAPSQADNTTSGPGSNERRENFVSRETTRRIVR